MTRSEKLLLNLNTTGYGMEIGPSHSPVAAKRYGFNVTTVDINTQEELQKKYAGHGVNLENIEPVDFIWKGESYASLVGKSDHFDWVIASHVIEHCPDLIGFLNSCSDVLKHTGILSLAIPDKRQCFDYFRPISGLGKVIDSHFPSRAYHSAGTIAEYLLNATRGAGNITWSGKIDGPFETICPVSEAVAHFNTSLKQTSTIDAHAWCFTLSSFRLLIHDLNFLGLISLKEVSYSPTEGHEFFFQLSRSGNGPSESRAELLYSYSKEN